MAGAALVATAAIAVTTAVYGNGARVGATAAGAGFTCAGVALLDREEPLVRAGAMLLLLPGLVVSTYLPGLPLLKLIGRSFGLLVGIMSSSAAPTVDVMEPLLTLGTTVAVGVAVFGGAGAWANAIGDGKVTEAVKHGGLAGIVMAVVAVPLLVLLFAALLLWEPILGAVLLPPVGRPRLVSLAVLAAGVAGVVGVALVYLPVVRALPADHHERAERVRRLLLRVAFVLAVGGVAAGLLVGILDLLGVVDAVYARLPRSLVTVLALTTGAVVRLPLAAAGTVAAAGILLGFAARRLVRDNRRWIGTVGVPLVGGVVLLGVVVPVVGSAAVLLEKGVSTPESVGSALALLALVAGGVFVLVIAGVCALAVLPVESAVGALPDRTAGPALLAAGTVGVAVFAGAGDASAVSVLGRTVYDGVSTVDILGVTVLDGGAAPPAVIAAAVGAGVVAWDLGWYGTDLTADLGHRPETREVERRHALRSLAVGGVGVGTAVGVAAVVGGIEAGLLPAAALAVVGVLALAIPLRG